MLGEDFAREYDKGAALDRNAVVVMAQDVEGTQMRDYTAVLSDRERQFTELVVEGLTYKQIAERCFVSVRTVESTLYNAMQKAGVSNRTDLADWFRVRSGRD